MPNPGPHFTQKLIFISQNFTAHSQNIVSFNTTCHFVELPLVWLPWQQSLGWRQVDGMLLKSPNTGYLASPRWVGRWVGS